jgi:hypothetical protein
VTDFSSILIQEIHRFSDVKVVLKSLCGAELEGIGGKIYVGSSKMSYIAKRSGNA